MRMPIKVTFKERMAGALYCKDGTWQAEFNIVAVSAVEGRDLMRGELPFEIKGRLEMGCPRGCCKTSAALRGYLTIDVLSSKLIYRFFYDYCKGTYLFEGEKKIRFNSVKQYWDTMTYLPGRVRDDIMGEDVGPAEFRFNLKKDLLPMLLSFRVRF